MAEIIALTCPVCGAPLGRDAENCQYCGSVIYIKPNAPRLSIANLNTSVIQEHINAFRKRVRANQYDEEAHYGLGVAYYSLGLVDAAVDELTVASRLMPENADIRFQLATVLHESDATGARDQLHHQFQALFRLNPAHRAGLELATNVLIEEQRWDLAASHALRLRTLDATRAEPMLIDIADALLRDGDLREARSVLEAIYPSSQRMALMRFIRAQHPPMALVEPTIDALPPRSFPAALALGVLSWLAILLLGSASGGTWAVSLVIITPVVIWRATAAPRYRRAITRDAYQIPDAKVVDTYSVARLLETAEMVARYRQGQLITVAEKLQRADDLARQRDEEKARAKHAPADR